MGLLERFREEQQEISRLQLAFEIKNRSKLTERRIKQLIAQKSVSSKDKDLLRKELLKRKLTKRRTIAKLKAKKHFRGTKKKKTKWKSKPVSELFETSYLVEKPKRKRTKKKTKKRTKKRKK